MITQSSFLLFKKHIVKILVFFACLLAGITAFSQGNIKWSADGTAFYANEKGHLVQYSLPSFEKKELVQPAQLTPDTFAKVLPVRDFFISMDGQKILIYTNTKKVWRSDTRGDYWVLDLTTKELRQVGKERPASSLMFAKFSPDGKQVAYVSGHNIYTEDLATGKIKKLTQDGTDRMINGTFDWAYEEEFFCRDGFRWSPDSKSIAYWQINAGGIRNFLMINNTDSLYSFVVPVEYPKVGQDPSGCRIGVITVSTGKTKWMNLPGDSRQHYIPSMEWAANSNELVLQQLNRKQNESRLFICNTFTGAASNIYSETDKAWIDVKAIWSDEQPGWLWLKSGSEFLWVSEKDGWRHIYRIGRAGREVLLTKDDYDVISVKAVDEKNGYVYFTASPKNATRQYLYRVSLTGDGKAEIVTGQDLKGTHQYTISPSGLFAKHEFSNHLNQRLSEWVSLPAHTVVKTERSQLEIKSLPAGETRVEFFQLTTADGVTMDGWIVKPRNFDSTKRYPVLFYVYAEPWGATVKDVAGAGHNNLYNGDLAADGYLQISLDGRGTPAPKGAAWRKAIYRNIGIINIRDQAMAAQKIRQWPFVDSSRLAVYGWSGGGSTTLNLLFQYPDIYSTGISIAPVPDQLLYDNIYQERYMGLPQEDKEPFIRGSPITHAKNLKGNLLVVHGTGDDNVHYQGTERLINELVRHEKKFQMMSYPNRTHSINEGSGTSKHLSNLFTDFLRTNCPGGGR